MGRDFGAQNQETSISWKDDEMTELFIKELENRRSSSTVDTQHSAADKMRDEATKFTPPGLGPSVVKDERKDWGGGASTLMVGEEGSVPKDWGGGSTMAV